MGNQPVRFPEHHFFKGLNLDNVMPQDLELRLFLGAMKQLDHQVVGGTEGLRNCQRLDAVLHIVVDRIERDDVVGLAFKQRHLRICGVDRHVKRRHGKKAYEEFLNDPNILTLEDEIAKTRAQYAYMEGKDAEFKDLSAYYKACNDFLNTISNLVAKAHKITEGEQYHINVQQVGFMVNRLVADITSVCADCPRMQELAEKIGQVDIVVAPRMIDGEVEE